MWWMMMGMPARLAARRPRIPALTAMSMNNIGLLRAQDFFQFAQRDEILERMNGTDKLWNNGQ